MLRQVAPRCCYVWWWWGTLLGTARRHIGLIVRRGEGGKEEGVKGAHIV